MCFGFGHLENEPGSQLSCVCFLFVKISCKYNFFGTYQNASGSLVKREKKRLNFNERSTVFEFINSTHSLCALALVILRTSPAANFCVSAFSLSSLRTSQAANYRVSAFSLSSLVVNTFSSVLIIMLRVHFSRGKN